MASDSKSQDKKATKSQEEIFNKFQFLRVKQRDLANKLSELKLDLTEQKMVIDVLKQVNGDRKCFRIIGGVLCERTVNDVLPVLQTNSEQLTKVIAAVTENLTEMGQEINKYKEANNIRIRGQDDIPEEPETEEASSSDLTRGNILVEKA